MDCCHEIVTFHCRDPKFLSLNAEEKGQIISAVLTSIEFETAQDSQQWTTSNVKTDPNQLRSEISTPILLFPIVIGVLRDLVMFFIANLLAQVVPAVNPNGRHPL